MRTTRSRPTLGDVASKMSHKREDVPMAGGLAMHQQQITFEYVDCDSVVRWGV
jgi:hypothetical protein